MDKQSIVKQKIADILYNGGNKTSAARYARETLHCGLRHGYKLAKRVSDNMSENGGVYVPLKSSITTHDKVDIDRDPLAPKKLDTDLEFSSKYVFNKEDDTYLFLLEKAFGKNIVLSGDTVRAIINNYSNFDRNPSSLNQISLRYSIPRNMLINILKILEITHDSLPVTNEELMEGDVEEIKEDVLAQKRFALHQKIQKEEWSQTEKDARRWSEFIAGKYNPFIEAIETWKCPNIRKIKPFEADRDDEKVFVCVLTDTHIGELVKHTWEGKTFNTDKAIDNIVSYLDQIGDKLAERKYFPSKCKLVIMGDILNSFVDGMTRKGTKLHNDIINADLFKAGLDIVITFVETLREMFEVVDISCVKGNHDSDLIYTVYYSASRFFESDPAVIWNISDYWLDSFRINNCYFIYSHGKDDVNHVSLPRGNTKKFESFIQSLLLSKLEDLIGVTSKYFISGHLHSFEHIERNDFEQIQVPSGVTADDFAEALGYMTKARQNCFIVGKNSIEETLHFFFE